MRLISNSIRTYLWFYRFLLECSKTGRKEMNFDAKKFELFFQHKNFVEKDRFRDIRKCKYLSALSNIINHLYITKKNLYD